MPQPRNVRPVCVDQQVIDRAAAQFLSNRFRFAPRDAAARDDGAARFGFPHPQPADAGQFGNEGRNIAQGPGYANFDFSAFKNIRLTESKEFQFRAEFFNIFNRTNFKLPNSDISSPTFNHIQAAQDPRLIQLALKFLF